MRVWLKHEKTASVHFSKRLKLIKIYKQFIMKHSMLILMCLVGLAAVLPAQGQILKKLKQKVEQSVDNRVDRKMDKAVEGTLDKTEEEISEIGKKNSDNSADKPQTSSEGTITQTDNKEARGGLGEINVGQDFIPGERTIYQTNFSKTPITNFPRELDFRGGEISVIKVGNQAVLQHTSAGAFAIKLPGVLPEKFTIEFSMRHSYYTSRSSIAIVNKEYKNVGTHYFEFSKKWKTGVETTDKQAVSSMKEGVNFEGDKFHPVQIMVDGSYVKMYVDGIRVANIPNANLGRSSIVLFKSVYEVSAKQPFYLTDIRIAAGGRDLYQTLAEEGRVAFNDIHFANGKAEILPESAETIREIAQLMKDHTDLNLLIEGHTDNTGNFDGNMELSKKRAEAVKNYLIGNHGIAENRLRSMGQGQTQPVDTNDTEEGRANNRRVEIVKI